MLVALPIALPEVPRAMDLLDWIQALGRIDRHKALLVFAHPVPREDIQNCVRAAQGVFPSVQAIRQHEAVETGWPMAANAMFRTAAQWIQQNPQPFLWLECDAIPLATGWLDTIAREYAEKGKPFLGCVYSHPVRHFNGVMVYPPTLSQLNPWLLAETGKPFDLVHPDIALRRGAASRTICRSLANPQRNVPHTFDSEASMSIIPEGCVVFHGCKDGTLIKQLRARAGIIAGTVHTIPHEYIAHTTDTPPLPLPDVTIWAASWSEDSKMLSKTIRVLRYCRKIINHPRTLLFSYLPVSGMDADGISVIPIPKLDWQTWSIFVNRVVPTHIDTEFAMSVHEDGFPINISHWNPDFLAYDYIGAPWLDGVVGNGGFNIESRPLLQAKMLLPVTPDELSTASDMLICRNYATVLKQRGIRFAPRDLALTFSSELFGNQWPSFGFHGRTLATEKYEKGWQLISAYENGH